MQLYNKNEWKYLEHITNCYKNILYVIWKCFCHDPCPFTMIVAYFPIKKPISVIYWLIFYIEYDLLYSILLGTCQGHQILMHWLSCTMAHNLIFIPLVISLAINLCHETIFNKYTKINLYWPPYLKVVVKYFVTIVS